MKEGWELKKLETVCNFQNGFAFKSKSFTETGTPVIRITNIQNEIIDLSKVVHIDKKDYDKDLSKYEIKKGDLLIAMSGATTGKIGIHQSDKVLLLNQRVGKFEPLEGLNRDYLFYFLSTKVEENLAISAGSAQPNLSTEQIKGFQIPISPLSEQRKIVAILDKAFGAIDQLISNIERNIENAKELYQSIFSSITNYETNDWVNLTVQDVAQNEKGAMRTGPFGSQLLHSEFVDDGIAVLGIDNAVANEFQWRKERYITPEKFMQLRKFQVKPRDVLITIMGTCGRCAIVPDDIPVAINTKHLCCISLDQNKCLPEYLHGYFLFHPIAQQYLKKKAKGAIMAGLNMGIIKEMPLLLPSIEEQIRITEILKIALKKNQLYIDIMLNKLDNLDELKKSVLQKAFAGKLV